MKTETINDDISKIKKEPMQKNVIYSHMPQGKYYAIFRCGQKYKSMGSIKGFFIHMRRERATPNANTLKTQENRQILGNTVNPYNDVKEYLTDCKIYKNSTIGRELLLTASPQFFKGISPYDFDKWININKKWLEDTFQDNVRYAILHLDETTPHIHALVIPKRWNERRKTNTLQGCYYFNGIEKLRGLQDSYAETMQQNFNCLQRGIKGSRASHIRMATFYAVANKDVSDMSREELETIARKEEMLSMKAKFNDKTLKSFQYQTGKKDEKITELEQTVLELLKENNELKKQISNEPQRVEKVERKRLKI